MKNPLENFNSSQLPKALRGALAAMEDELCAVCSGAGELSSSLLRFNSAGGKRLRPMLAWYCWHLSGQEMEVVPLMCMLELMHSASLIHDDLVDEARLRRGVESINALEGPLAAVRCGDYLLSQAMRYLETYRGTGINEALSQISQEMCMGELDGLEARFAPAKSDAESYFLAIRRKTALLMAESCRCGAVAGGAGSVLSEIFRAYGLHLGLAFQLRDDLLDWEISADTGKPPMQDLRSGVITLPLILALKGGDAALRRAAEKREKSDEDIALILRHVQMSGALKKTGEFLRSECFYAEKALSHLPDRRERNSLILLARKLTEVNING